MSLDRSLSFIFKLRGELARKVYLVHLFIFKLSEELPQGLVIPGVFRDTKGIS